MNGSISQMPGKRTNKEYEMQGWNAAAEGFVATDCPYFASSTAGKYWLRGLRSA